MYRNKQFDNYYDFKRKQGVRSHITILTGIEPASHSLPKTS
jgi:hypothetical protein